MTHQAYKVEGPALISFSGGRSSAYMLYEIVRAWNGRLPDDVHVCFANTGKEREETLLFVRDCAQYWGVHVNWLERSDTGGVENVSWYSASRNGEPFAALINKKKRLPNWQERWCTASLKVEPMHAFMQAHGHAVGTFTEVIGLRNDEGHRILRGMERAERDGRKVSYPLARAKVNRAAVMAFWRDHPFDLQLAPHEGNCDLCFLKGRGLRKRIIRDRPEIASWWQEQESDRDGFFDRRDRVADLVEEVHRSPELFDQPEDEEYDAECGLHCGEAA